MYSYAAGDYALAEADQSVAVGFGAVVSAGEKDAGVSGVAIGTGSYTTAMDGVALGSYSVADRAYGMHGYDPSTKGLYIGDEEIWVGSAGAVSVGGVISAEAENGNEETAIITRQITNVAAGSEDTDAVNVAQLKKVVSLTDANKEAIASNKSAIEANSLAIADTKAELKQDVASVNNRVSKLDNRMDKVGASAAALAALHPLQFNADDKFTVAAGFGNYKGEQAVALGGFYQANEDLLFSLGGTLGDEKMVNAGVSVRFGEKGEAVRVNDPESVRQLNSEVQDLRAKNANLETTVADQQSRLAAQDAELQAQRKVIEQLVAKVGL
ncbi:YadA-like family protein [Veillonella criceti]|uniref:Adhesin yadA n=1 Tax=Veillonella criceti TaxID=103891 RepID=A0A380NH22_9FIRM|nr:YadA-like family protein [Veillonella criceti]SUP40260.1 Adhesin yadA precursor [Veillonella criceti]